MQSSGLLYVYRLDTGMVKLVSEGLMINEMLKVHVLHKFVKSISLIQSKLYSSSLRQCCTELQKQFISQMSSGLISGNMQFAFGFRE